VLITGIGGFVASWIALGCFQRGYRVRGTVRSLNDESFFEHLLPLAREHGVYLELCEADLLRDAHWDAVVAHCDFVFHTASPVPEEEPKDPQEVLRPAVEGTLRVLRAASRAAPRPPRRVVLTSSITAMCFGRACHQPFSDADWSCTDSAKFPIGTYPQAKTLAEKAAWQFFSSLPAESRFEMVSINPSFAVGPMLGSRPCTSAAIFRKILLAEIPGLPNMIFDLVSVVDVARAHLLALTHPAAAGNRFMVHATQISMVEVAALLHEQFAPHGYAPTTMAVPDWILRALALGGDQSVKTVVPVLVSE
jgi:nucleoside-diphosphate-sugar epimerase